MANLGVLLLHGYTSSLDTVNGFVPILERNQIPYRMPVLRGHGTNYKDLRGVTAKDWYVDARASLFDLLKQCDQAIVIGLSMGGLVTLQLAMEHPKQIAGIATVAAAMDFKDPMVKLTPVLAKFFKYWTAPKPPKESVYPCTNYQKLSLDSFQSLREYGKSLEPRLHEVVVPSLIIGTKKDNVVKPEVAQIIYDHISSEKKALRWFERSGHEMMQDCECDEVFKVLEDYVLGFVSAPRA
jgi:carboxylesterase